MMCKKIIHLTVFSFFLFIIFTGCQHELSVDQAGISKSFNVKIIFKPVVDRAPLQFNKPYQNSYQETYSVEAFKFYITGIQLVNALSNKMYELSRNEYFLIDASDAGSTTIALEALPGKYDQVAFTIGVDSIRNVSGAQTGALDPGKGMFWTWNSGYIMAKLEGTSPVSNQPNNKFEYHIGGFREPVNVVWKVRVAFPLGQAIDFLPETTQTITLSADVNAWFNHSNKISIAANPVCMTPGDLAIKIAQNYSGMFTVTDIEAN